MAEQPSELLIELVRVRRLLSLVIRLQHGEALEKAEKDLASTAQRRLMYDMCDGTNSLQDIATTAGVTTEAVRQFIVQASRVGLVDPGRRSGKLYPERILA